ncbi:secreted RxLR effector protein 161-like [Humulus lupulus]|uniref:secreted RxLR effector protein 161-like n=1 Tax=Humulus lupulus TaxID=3486 RepID=UPI002B4170A1|nr:secreted RxLR effector protein 161-like [Humulus lupulus]
MGTARKILGIGIQRDRNAHKLKLSKSHYLNSVVKKFNMVDSKYVNVPLGGHFDLSSKQSPSTKAEQERMSKVPFAEAIRSVMYSMICTRSDIAYSVSLLSRFMANPEEDHWKVLKWLLRYLKTTLKLGLLFKRVGRQTELEGYVDADYASNKDTRKSLTSYCFFVNECCITWKSQMKQIVALSTTKAEFIATIKAFKEGVWMK